MRAVPPRRRGPDDSLHAALRGPFSAGRPPVRTVHRLHCLGDARGDARECGANQAAAGPDVEDPAQFGRPGGVGDRGDASQARRQRPGRGPGHLAAGGSRRRGRRDRRLRRQTQPALAAIRGFCSASMLVNREWGHAAITVSYDDPKVTTRFRRADGNIVLGTDVMRVQDFDHVPAAPARAGPGLLLTTARSRANDHPDYVSRRRRIRRQWQARGSQWWPGVGAGIAPELARYFRSECPVAR